MSEDVISPQYLIFEDIDVEVRGGRVFLGLFSEQRRQVIHPKLEHGGVDTAQLQLPEEVGKAVLILLSVFQLAVNYGQPPRINQTNVKSQDKSGVD